MEIVNSEELDDAYELEEGPDFILNSTIEGYHCTLQEYILKERPPRHCDDILNYFPSIEETLSHLYENQTIKFKK